MHRTLICSRRRGGQTLKALSFLYGLLAATVTAANPSGAQVVHGHASFAMPNAHTLEVTNSPSAILNWQSFNIGAGETTRFIQDSAQSAVLNRVMSGNPSDILGNLLSNGRVFLINPAGILIGRDAVVDTAGLVMSTLQIRDEDFLAGRLHFEGDADSGAITNHGYIKSAPGGEIILIAPRIVNETLPGNAQSGLIESPEGELVLAAGEAITIASLDHPDITFDVRAPEHEAINLGRLLAAGGSVNVLAGSIHHGGSINADAVMQDAAGNIVLAASSRVYLDEGSSVSASAAKAGGTVEISAGAGDGEGRIYALGRAAAQGESGGALSLASDRILVTGTLSARGGTDGGTVELDATTEVIATAAAHLDASGEAGQGGTVAVDGGDGTFSSALMTATGLAGGRVEVLGDDVKLAGATIDASGTTGGGTVRVGGGFKGGEDLPAATTTLVNASSVIKADAQDAGNGGSVVVWADGQTEFEGIISVRGGEAFGNGGEVEVSGKEALGFYGQVDVSAPAAALGKGEAGSLLLDPKDIVFTDKDVPVGVSNFRLIDPHPGENNNFGQSTQFFYDGVDFSAFSRLAVFDQFDDFGGADAGAVYLYRLSDGALLSALTGSRAGDRVGNNTLSSVAGVSVLRSTEWKLSAGAVTVFDTVNGVNGVLSGANSLVGATAGDQIGSGGLQTLGGSIAVRSPQFKGLRGAVTIAAPAALRGVVGGTNSLIGANANDQLGSGFFQSVGNGNFVLRSTHGGAGAVTFVNPANAPRGVIGAANSLVGSAPTDAVGASGIDFLGNYYGVRSPNWNGTAGAYTLGSTMTGIAGTVGAGNSLVGSLAGDEIGAGGIAQVGSFAASTWAVLSPGWDGNGIDAGAVSLLDASAGTFAGTANAFAGAVSAVNSLVGGSAGDAVGSDGISWVGGSLYAVRSPFHDNVGVGNSDTGAVTWYMTGNPLSGLVDASNSLLGIEDGDELGRFTHSFRSLPTGDALFVAPNYNLDAGAVAFIDMANPVMGDLDDTTALVGGFDDQLGSGGIQIFSDYYVVLTPFFDDGSNIDTGAVTVVDNAFGITGFVGGGNSLIGTFFDDRLGSGGIEFLFNGNALVVSPNFNSGAGAVTYLDFDSGALLNDTDFIASLSQTNSLVGDDPGDGIGSGGIELVGNHYFVLSPLFGTSFEGGAVTVADIDTGIAGIVSGANSFVGANFGDHVGSGGIEVLSNGNVLALSPDFDGGAGAVTFFDMIGDNIFGEADFTGTIDVDNSLVGSFSDDAIGSGGIEEFFTFGSTYYGVFSPEVDSPGEDFDVGAATFADIAIGIAGAVGSGNSLFGMFDGDRVGESYQTLSNGNLVLLSEHWNGDRGAATFVDLVNGLGLSGAVDDSNSIVGGAAGDLIGSEGLVELFGTDRYAILSPEWSNGGAAEAGAITWGDTSAGATGIVGTGNSLVGAFAGDRVGDCCGPIDFVATDLWVVETPDFDGGKSALTFFDPSTPPLGEIDAANSLLGSTAGDDLGSGGISSVFAAGGTRVIVRSPDWDNGGMADAGAITTFLASTPKTGMLDNVNSLVGTQASDRVGEGFLQSLSNGNRLLVNANWRGNTGAVTFWNPNTDLSGNFGSATSLVGSTAGSFTTGDRIGGWSVSEVSGSGRYYVAAPNWNNNRGALTFGSITSGVSGTVSAMNSLVGSSAGDRIGQQVTNLFATNRLLAVSPAWNASRGAVTVINPTAPRVGAVSSSNSLVGSSAGDQVGQFVQQLFRSGNQGLVVLRSTAWNNNAGAVTVFNPLSPFTGAVSSANSLVGRAGDQVGSFGVSELSGGQLLVRSPAWSNGQGMNFGAVTLMTSNNVGRVQRTTGFVSAANSLVGSHADDAVGNTFPTTLPSGNLLLRNPNWFANRGAVTFIDVSKGIAGEISAGNSLVGVLPDDFLGSGGITLLGGERALVRSPLASVNGIAGAGRLDIIDAGTLTPFTGNVGFGTNPEGELLVSIASLIELLNSGAALTLQANNDIILAAGLGIVADRGSLFFEAGRSIDIQGDLIVRDGVLSLLANAPGADAANRDAGDGNIYLAATDRGLRIMARELSLDAQNIFVSAGDKAGAHAAVIGLGTTSIHAHGSGLLRLEAGTAPGTGLVPGASEDIVHGFLVNPEAVSAPIALVFGLRGLAVFADDIELLGGGSEGAFAALASFGEFDVEAQRIDLQAGSAANADALLLGLGGVANITFNECNGCDELLFDPLADSQAQTGIFVSGIFLEPTVDAILAMLGRDSGQEEGEEEDDDDEEEAQCN